MSMLIDFFEKLRISVLSTTWPSKLCRVSLTRPLVLGRLSYTNGRLKFIDGRLSYISGRLSYINGRLSYTNGRVNYINGRLS